MGRKLSSKVSEQQRFKFLSRRLIITQKFVLRGFDWQNGSKQLLTKITKKSFIQVTSNIRKSRGQFSKNSRHNFVRSLSTAALWEEARSHDFTTAGLLGRPDNLPGRRRKLKDVDGRRPGLGVFVSPSAAAAVVAVALVVVTASPVLFGRTFLSSGRVFAFLAMLLGFRGVLLLVHCSRKRALLLKVWQCLRNWSVLLLGGTVVVDQLRSAVAIVAIRTRLLWWRVGREGTVRYSDVFWRCWRN